LAFVFGGIADKLAGGPETFVPCLVMRQITPVPGTGDGKGPAPATSKPITPISTTYNASPFAENLASTGRLGPAVACLTVPGPGDRLLKKGCASFVAGSILTTV